MPPKAAASPAPRRRARAGSRAASEPVAPLSKAATPKAATPKAATPVTKPAAARGAPLQILNKSGAPAVPVVPADHVDGFVVPTRPTLVPSWAVAWLMLSSAIVLWDASYVLLQPLSFYPDGKFGMIWVPYAKYATVDKLYSRASYEAYLAGDEGWGVTQSLMNLVEVALLFFAAAFASIGQRGASLLVIVSCVMTAAKTVAYFLIDYNENWKMTGHNDAQTWWTLFFFPSSLWIIFPVLVAYTVMHNVWREL